MKKQIYLPLLIILLASLVSGVLPVGQPAKVYANPAEYLLNPSFTGGTTDWTLSIATYDGVDFQDTAGSIKTITAVGRNKTATGTASQAIGTSINSTDTVTLSLYWKKTLTFPSVNLADLKAQIALPSAPTTWIDIWSETSLVTQDWTAVTALDVSAYFTETGTYQFRYYMNLQNPNESTAQRWAWIDNTSLDVVPAPPDISNTPTSFGFGALAEGGTYETTGGLTTAYFTVTNNSAFAVNITIGGTDMTGGVTWTLSDDGSAGNMIYGLNAGLEGGSYSVIVPKTGSNTLISGLAASGSQKWGLQLLAPTTFTDGGAKSGTVTLTATQS